MPFTQVNNNLKYIRNELHFFFIKKPFPGSSSKNYGKYVKKIVKNVIEINSDFPN